MEILRNLLLFLSLCVKVFNSELVNRPNLRTSKALILNHCNKDYKNIIIIDDSNELNLRWIQQLHEHFHSVTLYKGNLQDPENYSREKKIDAILITISSSLRIKPILKDYSKIIWWDVMIPVYILNLPGNECLKTISILTQTWIQKILTVYFICGQKYTVSIYTYNPFTKRAPTSWKEVQRSSIQSSWTLYHRRYHKASICHELDFDRTKYLDGYQITVLVSAFTPKGYSLVGQYINHNDLQPNETIAEDRYHLALNAFEKMLNISLRLYVIDEDQAKTSKKSFRQIVERICKKVSASMVIYDSLLYTKIALKNSLLVRSYPLAWRTLGIATYHHGYRTLAEKMWNFYGTWTILFTIFVLFITFVVIRFVERKETAFAAFEILRLLTNHSLFTRMNILYQRIFFITILIYFLVIQATFSGHLAKFLTKSELRRHPETLEDLEDLGYTKVYNSSHITNQLRKIGKKIIKLSLKANYCLHHLLYEDPSIGCLFDHSFLFEHAHQAEQLYLSKKPLQVQYTRYPIIKYWPLLNRVNMVMMTLEDSGFRKFHSNKLMKNFIKSTAIAESKLSEDFHPIELQHLTFCFSILAIGLISAIVSFCAEILANIEIKHILDSYLKKQRKKFLMRVNRINTRHKAHK